MANKTIIDEETCKVSKCQNNISARGLCNRHYLYFERNDQLKNFPKIYTKTNLERFWEKVDKTETCWLWIASINVDGYGRFYTRNKHTGKRKHWRAHRYSYVKFIGKIPKGLTLDHLCRVRNCVNPEHLEAVTVKENQLRGYSVSGINARKTHCIYGHKFTKTSTYIYPDGRRQCKICKLEYQRLHRRIA